MLESPLIELIESLSINTLWTAVKWFYLVGFLLYVVFAIVVMSQIRQMTNTLNGTMDLPLKLVGWIHFGLAVGGLVVAIVIL